MKRKPALCPHGRDPAICLACRPATPALKPPKKVKVKRW
jgi:hypothetical protein